MPQNFIWPANPSFDNPIVNIIDLSSGGEHDKSFVFILKSGEISIQGNNIKPEYLFDFYSNDNCYYDEID